MSSVDKHIKDLIQFYVKENYKHYLTKNNITHINEPDIEFSQLFCFTVPEINSL